MSFFGRSGPGSGGGGGSGPSHRPFSIDDAFDIPEEDVGEDDDEEAAAGGAPDRPIIRNGQLRLA